MTWIEWEGYWDTLDWGLFLHDGNEVGNMLNFVMFYWIPGYELEDENCHSHYSLMECNIFASLNEHPTCLGTLK